MWGSPMGGGVLVVQALGGRERGTIYRLESIGGSGSVVGSGESARGGSRSRGSGGFAGEVELLPTQPSRRGLGRGCGRLRSVRR